MRKAVVVFLSTAMFCAAVSFAAAIAQETPKSTEPANAEITLPEIPENATPAELKKLAQEAQKDLFSKITADNQKAIQVKFGVFLEKVADKIIAAKPEGPVLNEAYSMKLSSLSMQSETDASKLQEINALANELREKKGDPQLLAMAKRAYFSASYRQIMAADKPSIEEFNKLKAEYASYLKENQTMNAGMLSQLFVMLGNNIAQKLDDKEFPETNSKDITELLKANGLEYLALTQEYRTAEKLTVEQYEAIKAAFKTLLKKDPSTQAARGASQLVELAEKVPDQPELPARIRREMIDLLKASESKEVQNVAKFMEGEIRRAELIGKDFSLEGVMLDGTKFDWAKYKGKAVLIDFWATWCGPCRAEVPFMKELYEKYHAKGFEVVGINVWERDKTTAEVIEYLKEENVPWAQIDDTQSIAAGNDSLPEMYGISGIPTLFLIGKDGKVISTTVRGHNKSLQEAVDKIFAEK